MPRGGCRTNYRWVEAGDDEAWRSTDCDASDDASSGDVEHKYLTVGERHEAELPVAGDGDRLRGTAQADNSRWFPRRRCCACRDRNKDIQLVVLPIRHVDLACGRIVIHWAKLPPTEQRPDNPPRTQVNGNDGTLAGGYISGKTAGDADILRSTCNRHRAKQVSVHFEDRERSGSGDPELIES